MSTRAYKVIKIEREPEPTFNFRDNQDIIDLAYIDNMGEGSGYLCFQKETLEDELKVWKDRKTDGITDYDGRDTDEKIDMFERMIKDCGDDDEVEYECF